jgi:hypothetical protein
MVIKQVFLKYGLDEVIEMKVCPVALVIEGGPNGTDPVLAKKMEEELRAVSPRLGDGRPRFALYEIGRIAQLEQLYAQYPPLEKAAFLNESKIDFVINVSLD